EVCRASGRSAPCGVGRSEAGEAAAHGQAAAQQDRHRGRSDGNIAPVMPAALSKNVPQPFKAEPVGGGGTRMHHKFVVIDFDKPSARVYLGSYNFSTAADRQNGENLLLIRDRRIAVSYVVEALRIFDHYHFRVTQQEAKKAKKELVLARPPRKPGDKPWWSEHYTD